MKKTVDKVILLNMKINKYKLRHSYKPVIFFFFAITIGFPIFFTPLITINNKTNYTINLHSANGVSNYTITESITYQVDMNMTFTQTGTGSGEFYFKFPRYNDRQPSSLLTQYTPPYQESELLYLSITGSEQTPWLYHDRFNNTFDIFNNTALAQGNSIKYSSRYNITMNEITFGDIDNYDPGYDVQNPIFDLYCNNSEEYYNITDSDLINAANNECGIETGDAPVTKARKICTFVTNNLTFTSQTQERGASWAYDNKQGDCSEYASLMITLLRIHGIPARKVHGYLASDDFNFKPYLGYTRSSTMTGITGHTWVEYYVPNIGWIACEPQIPSKYKTSSYLGLVKTIGAWFKFPNYDDTELNVSEFIPLYSRNTTGSTWDSSFKITVVSSDFPIPSFNNIGTSLIGEIGLIAVFSIGIIYAIERRKRKY